MCGFVYTIHTNPTSSWSLSLNVNTVNARASYILSSLPYSRPILAVSYPLEIGMELNGKLKARAHTHTQRRRLGLFTRSLARCHFCALFVYDGHIPNTHTHRTLNQSHSFAHSPRLFPMFPMYYAAQTSAHKQTSSTISTAFCQFSIRLTSIWCARRLYVCCFVECECRRRCFYVSFLRCGKNHFKRSVFRLLVACVNLWSDRSRGVTRQTLA